MESKTKQSATELNREFYDDFWSRTRLERAERFNTWPVVSEMLPSAPSRLEVGPGLHPRLPVAGTHFIDLSPWAIRQLVAGGGIAVAGDMTRLPFGDGTFDLIAAFDVIEHMDDDQGAFRELSRVLKEGGTFVFSVPIHSALWTDFDTIVGHVRRYECDQLLAMLARNGLVLERSAGFGMKPKNGRLVKWGMWWLSHHPEKAFRWYNRLFRPLGLYFQKPLEFEKGLIDPSEVQGLVLICRRELAAETAPDRL